MLLYALARLKNEGETRFSFADAEAALAPLLKTHAPPVKAVQVRNPFIRLSNDGFWAVREAGGAPWVAGTHVPATGALIAQNPVAGFDQPTLDLLRRSPGLINRAARLLLDEHFPPSIQDDLLGALGLDLDSSGPRAGMAESGPQDRRRDPAFRINVLNAYRRRCACCGFSLRVGDGLVAVDAAHIRWHTHEGPDEVRNGLALCALHHRLFDYGVLTVDLSRRIRVAESVNGEYADALLRLDRQDLALPHASGEAPDDAFLKWHHRNVFKGRSDPPVMAGAI